METVLLPLPWLGKQPLIQSFLKWDVGGTGKQKISFDTRKELENGKIEKTSTFAYNCLDVTCGSMWTKFSLKA